MSKNVSLLLSLVLGAVLGFALSRIVPLVGGRALDPAAVAPRASEILNGSDPLRRIAEFGALLEHLGPEAVPAVTEAFDAAPLEVGDPEVIVFATWRASLDPQAPFEWTRTDWRAGDGAVIASLFRSWARRDPQKALQNVAQLRLPRQLDAAED